MTNFNFTDEDDYLSKFQVLSEPKPNQNWSSYQTAIFRFIKESTDNLVVEALAGSGKTTTAVECASFLPQNKENIFVAFNKKIALELRSRLPDFVEAGTLHSIGLKQLLKIYNCQVDTDKMSSIFKKIIGDDKENNELIYLLCKAVSLSKSALASSFEEIDLLLDVFDVQPPESCNRDTFINHVLFGLDASVKQTKKVDFDDMIYIPVKLNLAIKQYDNVFVDEAQDLNPSQIEFVFKLIKKSGRCIVFGDQNQAIYGFRGADKEAFLKFKSKLNSTSLSLPITYRCPLSVVNEAQKIVPDLLARDNAPNGIVDWVDYDKMLKSIKPGSYIISRTNSPLVRTSLKLIKQKIPCTILGRDIGNNLFSLVKSSKAKTLEKFSKYLEKWKNKEVNRLILANRDCSHIFDKYECIQALMEDCNSITDLKNNIQNLFDDSSSENVVTLGSTHQMKGLENNIVYMFVNTYSSSTQEEKNLKYVAITRAKDCLYYVKFPK